MNNPVYTRRQDLCMSVGVMNDLKLNLRNLHSSYTLGCLSLDLPLSIHNKRSFVTKTNPRFVYRFVSGGLPSCLDRTVVHHIRGFLPS